VLIHGDATPTNFLFPNGRAVALDLERLRVGDRLWDLSWVAGELKHAWGWRTTDFSGSEAAIRHFFRMYLTAAGLDPALTRRLFSLNPFYMALAELRIARNLYLTRDYRRELVAEARRCLAHGRKR
jgi:aminoglycoside phosphotransferase (APT) family kinase protein